MLPCYITDIMLPEELKPLHKAPPKIPCEAAGTGLNKKVYYVTSERKFRILEVIEVRSWSHVSLMISYHCFL